MTSEQGSSGGASSSSTPEPARLAHPITKAERLEPPVTKKSLSKLDVDKIIHNPKLRHDIKL